MSENENFRIVFMGTPYFAVPSLEALIKAGFHIAAVITAPDRPAGRGMKLQESDVKKAALKHGIKILQPTNLKAPEFVDELKTIRPDVQVVVAFRMLPEVVWNLPPLGTINLHASLLPQYRGAAPINHAIMNGEKETGVTTFKLKHEIDTGNILLQQKIPILKNDTAGTVHDKLMNAGAGLLVTTIKGLKDGTLKEIDQDELLEGTTIHHAPKIFREDCEIRWNKGVEQVFNQIRGLSPYPGAFTFLNEKRIIITEQDMELSPPSKAPGDYETDGKTFLKIAAADGFIQVLSLKPEGKREMKIGEFLRGQRDL